MSDVVVQPYLTFGGRCEEAIAFYQAAIGATPVMVMRFHESPDPMPPGVLAPGFENKIMHARLHVGSTAIMASDGCHPGVTFSGFSLSLSLDSVADANRAFGALSDGGKVTMPMSKTFWSPAFGMVEDRFGVSWMVTVADASHG